MEVLHFRGPRNGYDPSVHEKGIYFAIDTQEILYNGLSFSGTLPPELQQQIEANTANINLLLGDEEGSVNQLVTQAINDFATKLSDDKTINTFKELVDFVATDGELLTDIKNIKDEQANLVNLVNQNTEDIADLKNTIDETIDSKIEYAFSWKNVN